MAVSSGQGQGTHRWTRWGEGDSKSKWGRRHRSSLRGKTYCGNKLTFHVEASGSRFLQLTLGGDRKSGGGGHNMFFRLLKSFIHWEGGECETVFNMHFILLLCVVITGLAHTFFIQSHLFRKSLFRIWVHSSLIPWQFSVAWWLNYLRAPAWND